MLVWLTIPHLRHFGSIKTADSRGRITIRSITDVFREFQPVAKRRDELEIVDMWFEPLKRFHVRDHTSQNSCSFGFVTVVVAWVFPVTQIGLQSARCKPYAPANTCCSRGSFSSFLSSNFCHSARGIGSPL